jgi:hypothetical protein
MCFFPENSAPDLIFQACERVKSYLMPQHDELRIRNSLIGRLTKHIRYVPEPIFTPGPPGVNLAPRGDISPLGVMLTPSFTPQGWTLFCLEEWRGEQIISLPGDNFTTRGQNSPLGQLRMGLRGRRFLRSVSRSEAWFFKEWRLRKRRKRGRFRGRHI